MMKASNNLNLLRLGLLTTVLAVSSHEQKPMLPNGRADQITVAISSATVIGSVADDVESFRGIPYAEPPVGGLRLKPPVRLTANLGEFDATEPGPSCPQFGGFVPVKNPILGDHEGGQEDCLTVTVQRPAGVTDDSALPVLFWIYGGAFQFGSTEDYDATDMLKAASELGKPFVFVAVNHRIGGFGFLGGEDILNDGSANLGLLDQRMGLEWTADNVAHFGGDPRRVTIWGESAGAISVINQLALYGGNATYNDAPLFRSAIINSGGVTPTDPVDCPKAQDIYDTVVANADCHDAADKLACLRGLDFADFHRAVNSVPSVEGVTSLALSYLPRPDGTVLRDSTDVSARNGEYYAVPMIIGNQEDEGTLFAREEVNPGTTESIVQYLSKYFFHHATKEELTNLVETWPVGAAWGSPFRTGILYRPYAGYKRLSALLGDVGFILLRRFTLSLTSSANPDVPSWSYISSYLHDATGITKNPQGTFHATDIFYGMFGLSNLIPDFQKLPYPIKQTRAYYLNFLYNLDPNVGLPVARHWPTWTEGEKPTLLQFNLQTVTTRLDNFRSDSYDYIKAHSHVLYA